MLPGRALVLLAIAPLVLALLMLIDATLLWPMLATDGGILLVALADAAFARRPLVRVERSTREVFSIAQPNLVTVTLRSLSKRQLTVTLNDDLFDGAQAPDLPASTPLSPKGRAEIRYHVRPTRRGAFVLGDLWLRYRSPLGLWIRQLRVALPTRVRVYPDVRAVRTYELLARENREQSLFRTTRRRGGESEFERLREYRREDEYRAIDWKATARKRQLIAREYQLESDQSIVFVLDAGRLMTAESAGLSLFDHALNATLMLSHVAARNGDRVGLLAFSDSVKSFAAPSAGRRATQKIVQAGYHLYPELVESQYELAFEHLSGRVRKRSLIILFTQVADEAGAYELLRLTRGLMPRHLTLAVLFRDADVDALLEAPLADERNALIDAYVRGAAAEVVTWRDRFARELKKRGAMLLDARPGELTPALINRYLEIKARHLL